MLNINLGNINKIKNTNNKPTREKSNVVLPQMPIDTFEKNNDEFYIKLSKKMAYALRHKPEQCGLKLNNEGYTDVNNLIKYLKSIGKFSNVTVKDIEDTMKKIEKKRFELNGDKIRAYYGHSCKQKIIKESTTPPTTLYHGTSREAARKILKEGITPQSRQFVHLSADIETAQKVGSRKDKKPIILLIDTSKANKDGIKFYLGNETTWLADYIPPQYITIKKSPSKIHKHG